MASPPKLQEWYTLGMRRFVLNRTEDESGVSGTGIVAEGIMFSDGRVVMRWCVGEHRSTSSFDSIEDVLGIHGHEGKTQVKWIDNQTLAL